MFKATTKFMGSVIHIGTRDECLKIAKTMGIPRKEFTITKIA